MLCGFLALATTAPVPSRGGAASEIHALNASSAVLYDPVPEEMHLFDATIKAVEQERHDAEVAAYLAAVHQAEVERVAAEKAAREKARVASTRAAVASAPARVGPCGGWEGDIAARWPAEQVGTACRIMMCESGGNPTAANTRSSASGLWQALDSTWSGWGGYARALHAPPSVQMDHGYALWQSRGWQPWVCR